MPSSPPPPPSPPQSAAGSGSGRPRRATTYSVLLERRGVCKPVATTTSLHSPAFPLSDGHADDVVELSCRLVLQHGQVQLHLTFHPSHTPARAKHHASYAEIAHHTPHTRSLGAVSSSRRTPPSVPLGTGNARAPAASSGTSGLFKRKKAKSKNKGTSSPSPSPLLSPATPTSRHAQPTQHYTIVIKEIAPVAALLPLSAELRSQLHLNLVDTDAATYSSHSTPRAVGVSSLGGASGGSPGVPVTLSTNFVLPPGRYPTGRSTRTRESSLSARVCGGSSSGGGGVARGAGRAGGGSSFLGGHAGTAATYGQYLDASEPYRHHSFSQPSQTGPGRGVRAASAPAGSLGTELDATLIKNTSQPRCSQGSSATSSRLLSPMLGSAPAPQTLPLTHLSSLCVDPATPPYAFATTPRANVVAEYAELFSVAVFGMTNTAGVRNCSFSLDEEGQVVVKKSKKFSYRKLPQTLLGWMLPFKKEPPHAHSARSLSSRSTQRSEAVRTPTTPAYSSFCRPPLHSKAHSSHAPPHSPVLASDAHVDPHDVLDLPFTLSESQTFQLRFRDESDVRDFLTRYVELQTRAKEMEREKKKAGGATAAGKKPMAAASGALRGPLSETAWPEGSQESLRTCEWASRGSGERHDDDDSDHSLPTQPFNEYPRNADAFGDGRRITCAPEPTVIFADGLVGGGRCTGSGDASRGGWTDTTAVDGVCGGPEGAGDHGSSACSTPVPTFFFGSRGWPEYVRHAVDPRYGLPFATVPLFLWHAFLPLAASVLYSCDRGFLVVEGLPPPSWPARSEDGTHGAGSGTAPDPAREHLNHLVSRLVAPIRTARPTRATPAQQPWPTSVDRHGVVEVLPATSGPPAEASDSASNSGTSWDGVKLVLPINDDAAIEPADDHFTTFKDVFLCLSETHLLFLNSFGHLRYQCSFDEIAIITHSDSTEAFPTYPFIRFRFKSTDAAGAPSFVFTFTLLPDIPVEMRTATNTSAAAARGPHMHRGVRSGERSATATANAARQSLSSPATSVSASASWSTTLTPGASLPAASDAAVVLLEEEEKVRLVRRHKALLTAFETVCDRQLEKCVFSDVAGGDDDGRAFRARVSQFLSQTSTAVSGSPIASTASRGVGGASTWMTQQHNTNAILCVMVEAGDINVSDSGTRDGGGDDGEGRSGVGPLPMPLWRGSNGRWQQRRESRQRSLPMCSRGALTHTHCSAAEVTPRWGRDDPGIVLQDAGHDMDLSLERATRTMPLLALKQEVCDQYAASRLHSREHSFHPCHPETEAGPSKDPQSTSKAPRPGDPEDSFVPMMPKKRGSRLVHRAAVHK